MLYMEQHILSHSDTPKTTSDNNRISSIYPNPHYHYMWYTRTHPLDIQSPMSPTLCPTKHHSNSTDSTSVNPLCPSSPISTSTHPSQINTTTNNTNTTKFSNQIRSNKSPLINSAIKSSHLLNEYNLKAVLVNAQSIWNKVIQIMELASHNDLDIICITETRLNFDDTPIISCLNTGPCKFIINIE